MDRDQTALGPHCSLFVYEASNSLVDDIKDTFCDYAL